MIFLYAYACIWMFLIRRRKIDLTGFHLPRQCDDVPAHDAPEFRGCSSNRYPPHLPRIARGFGLRALFFVCALLPAYAPLPLSPARAEPAPGAVREKPALRAFRGPSKPAFVLQDLDGANRRLEDYRGRPVLVHFFATWCEPCRPEMQALKQMSRQPAAKDLQILALSVDEPRSRLQRFFDNLPVGFPILMDEDRDIAKAWDVTSLPTSYLLDADLVPRLYAEHDVAWDRLDIPALLQTLTSPPPVSKHGEKQ
jgi:peroxiredoxin